MDGWSQIPPMSSHSLVSPDPTRSVIYDPNKCDQIALRVRVRVCPL